ncbi:pimeloyl-ACP methyl ester carboxylesterase [Loktanella sp. PT4BL]|uniref:alpha/beta fold hydrolase n=1 Tax=Loktanella sp. PT4BL TaxID=2135611 RepID=UPI000D761B3E|nr:alpha/beta hydrolase [Loktanella sp. PT4BL]PXW70401.1 pimeloyl-ACP methyl ester carboxylesterase [Loktanella sp. PT4BL]
MAVKTLSVILGVTALATAVISQYRAAQATTQYPPLGQFVDVTGGQVHYVQDGSGPHLVLLHGAGGNLREWTFDLMNRLTDRYTVTAFDRPGLGYTDRVPGIATGLTATEGDSPQAQAAMLREAAEKLGITDPIVAGHSFGGIVSYAWAVAGLDQDSPANASAIVSFAGVTMPWPGGLDRYYTVNGSAFGGVITIPAISAFVPPSVVDSSIEATFAPQSAPAGYADYIGAGLTLRPSSMRANTRQVNTSRPHVVQLSQRYPELTLPIEILHGEEDTTVPIHIHAEEIAKIVPQVNTTRLPGVGHMPHHADPLAAISAIDRAALRAGIQP